MPEIFSLTLNGAQCRVAQGTTVAAALLNVNQATRVSVTGEGRAPLCGMGICFECRAVVNGISHRRTCQILCEPDMTVESDR